MTTSQARLTNLIIQFLLVEILFTFTVFEISNFINK